MKKLEKELSIKEKELEEVKGKLSEHGEIKVKLKKMESMQVDSDGLRVKMTKQEEQLKTLKSESESKTAEISDLEIKLSHEQSVKKRLEE